MGGIVEFSELHGNAQLTQLSSAQNCYCLSFHCHCFLVRLVSKTFLQSCSKTLTPSKILKPSYWLGGSTYSIRLTELQTFFLTTSQNKPVHLFQIKPHLLNYMVVSERTFLSSLIWVAEANLSKVSPVVIVVWGVGPSFFVSGILPRCYWGDPGQLRFLKRKFTFKEACKLWIKAKLSMHNLLLLSVSKVFKLSHQASQMC